MTLTEPGKVKCVVVFAGTEASGGSSTPSALELLTVPLQQLYPQGPVSVVEGTFTRDALSIMQTVGCSGRCLQGAWGCRFSPPRFLS